MPDLDRDLGALAPDVDTDAALEQFRRRRGDRPSRRWPVLAAAAVLLLIAAVAGVVTLAGDDDAPVTSGPAVDGSATNGDDVPFEVLSVEPAVAEMGTLAAVTADDQAPEFWDQTGASAPYPEVDFAGTVLVAITIPDDACPPDLTEFTRSGDTLTPVFVETVDVCNEPLIPKTYVVAFPRDLAEDSITVRLPADDTYGFDEQLLTLSLGDGTWTSIPAREMIPDPPPCADIERFADRLVDTGIAYDYDATESPDEVFASSDIAFTGRLTGELTSEVDEAGGGIVGYEVEIDVLHKSPPGADVADPFTVYVEVASTIDPAEFEPVVLPGIPVLVMAEWVDRPAGTRPIAGAEGFATGCPGEKPIGFVGFAGEWPDIDDLHTLTKRYGT